MLFSKKLAKEQCNQFAIHCLPQGELKTFLTTWFFINCKRTSETWLTHNCKWMSWDDTDPMPRNDTEKQWPQEEEYSKFLPSVCKDKGHQGLMKAEFTVEYILF